MGVHASQLRAFFPLQSTRNRSFPATVPSMAATTQAPWLSPVCWNFRLANASPTPQASSPVVIDTAWLLASLLGPPGYQGFNSPFSKSEWRPPLASAGLADKTSVRASNVIAQTVRDLPFMFLVFLSSPGRYASC